jgi:hypothetical protein
MAVLVTVGKRPSRGAERNFVNLKTIRFKEMIGTKTFLIIFPAGEVRMNLNRMG